MLTEQEIRTIAQKLKNAQDNVQQIAPITSRYSELDATSAYAVLQLIHEARLAEGAIPVGRKIGFTNADMWPLFDVNEPVWGYVYDTTTTQLSRENAKCSIKKFSEPKIEPEIVFHFHAAPPINGDLVALLESVDWIAPAFDIGQSHFPDWKFKAADTIADSALHAALLVGEHQSIDKLRPNLLATLESFSVELCCNSQIRATGKGSNVLGSPLLAAAHLISVLSRQPQFQPIQANELVTTGSITTAQSVLAGEIWSADFHGIGLSRLSVEFTE